MVVYDISAEITSAPVYPGDPQPKIEPLSRMSDGGEYNLSALNMCLHTGTHVEAPAHFVDGGVTVGEMDLSVFMGGCSVVACNAYHDDLTGADIEKLLPAGATRVLFKTLGQCRLTRSAVFAIISSGVQLVGIDDVSIAPDDDEAAVHRELGLAGVAVLEGLALRHVQSGEYTLFALPVKLDGVEAAPCRAVLMK
jgi:arylformamidase